MHRKPRRQRLLATLEPRGRLGGIDVIADLLARTLDATSLAPGQWVVDVGDGRTVRAVLERDRVTFHGALDPTRFRDEEHGGWQDDPHVNDALVAAVEELARPLQRATRWALLFESGDAIVADERCPGCATLCFVWERACPACGSELGGADDEEPPRDDDDELARQLVDALLAAGYLELDGRHRNALESAIAAAFANLGGATSTVARTLLEHPAVVDLYCDDEELDRMIEALFPSDP